MTPQYRAAVAGESPRCPWGSYALDDFGRASIYRDAIAKPVIFDEARYEGHIESRWGQLTAEEMVEHFWIGTIGGTYVGHGEVLGAAPTSAPAAADGRAVIWTGRGGDVSSGTYTV